VREEGPAVGSQLSIHDVVLVFWGLLALSWALSLAWVGRDVHRRFRGRPPQLASVLATLLLPGFGLLVYLVLRPGTTLEQRHAHALWLELAERTRSSERCPSCLGEVEAGFLACPACATTLRRRCSACDAALEAEWLLCPYCETPVGGAELEPTGRGAADERLTEPAAEPAPVAAPARHGGKRRGGTKVRAESVPKRAA
jgi:hypothetical protein